VKIEYPSLGYFSTTDNVIRVPKYTGTREQKLLQELLRNLRSEAGLTQKDLAVRLGEPQSYISKYESGERRLDFLEIRHLCKQFGISVSDFSKRLEVLINES
jgi:transcriptional regulator with XRE-family HTH domain